MSLGKDVPGLQGVVVVLQIFFVDQENGDLVREAIGSEDEVMVGVEQPNVVLEVTDGHRLEVEVFLGGEHVSQVIVAPLEGQFPAVFIVLLAKGQLAVTELLPYWLIVDLGVARVGHDVAKALAEEAHLQEVDGLQEAEDFLVLELSQGEERPLEDGPPLQ
eukprot:CAMPEP_0170485158 /NCGR_PEP_ID=MMETSP0208-20121228/4480_1 /TAXON_ID=197538 /ORGANISM="Strombidium inclinatum, Strain S3" /LENGTH=160 /DNA_ID=CAMNT_0010758717 /DNA_START=1238 /DNA_END=1717 /DNA_ORIENTATION=+